eukprot:877076_1
MIVYVTLLESLFTPIYHKQFSRNINRFCKRKSGQSNLCQLQTKEGHSSYTDEFIQIVKNKGFVIDKSLAEEFKQYVEGPNDEKQRAPCGTICFHCYVAKDSTMLKHA